MNKHKKKHVKFRTVGVALLDEQVLIHQTAGKNYWSLPGGHIEFNEDSRKALKREFMEETGLSITVNTLLWTTENFFTRSSGKSIHEIAFYYDIAIQDSFQKSFIGHEKDKTLQFQWVPIKTLPKYPLKPAFLITALQNPLPIAPIHLIIRSNHPNRKAP